MSSPPPCPNPWPQGPALLYPQYPSPIPPPYATDAEVQAVWPNDYPYPTAGFDPAIAAAHELVVAVCTLSPDPAYQPNTGLLTQIEIYLAAHFAACTVRIAAAQKTGDASITFTGKTGMYFDATEFGQRAMELDISGGLARINQGLKKGNLRRTIPFYHIGDSCNSGWGWSGYDGGYGWTWWGAGGWW